MVIILNNYIKILFIVYFLLYESKELLIKNPKILLSEVKYPVIFDGNNQYYNVITYGNTYFIEKLTGNVVSTKSSNTYSPPYFLCIDETYNHFLFANKIYYKIHLNSNYEIINLEKNKTINFDSDAKFVGWIKQYKYNNLQVGENEIILYGRKEKKSIYFFYINKLDGDTKSFSSNLNEKITCK